MARWLLPDSVGLFSSAFKKGLATTLIASSLIAAPAMAENIGATKASRLKSAVNTVVGMTDKNPATREITKNLLFRTAVHESQGMKYLKQMGGGPAMGYFQIEPSTAADIVQRYAKTRPEVMSVLEKTSGFTRNKLMNMTKAELAENLRTKDLFSAAVARFKYKMAPETIPQGLKAQAAYWGKYYQTTSNPKKIAGFIENNTQFSAQIQNVIKKQRLAENKTVGLVTRVLDKKKVNHTIKNVITKTKHLFKVR